MHCKYGYEINTIILTEFHDDDCFYSYHDFLMWF